MTRHLLMRCWEQFCAEQCPKRGKSKAGARHRAHKALHGAACSPSPCRLPALHMGPAYVNLELQQGGKEMILQERKKTELFPKAAIRIL